MESELNMQGEEIDEILDAIKHGQSKIDLMQKALYDIEKREYNRDHKHEPKELPIPPHILKEDEITSEESFAIFDKINDVLDDDKALAN